MKVAVVRPKDVEDLHRKITKAGSPIVANRVIALLSKLFSLAIRWEMPEPNDNPVKGAVERNPETKRKVYLKPGEIARLSEALTTGLPAAGQVRAAQPLPRGRRCAAAG